MEELNKQQKEANENIITGAEAEEIVQHLNNPVSGPKPIVKKYLGAVQQVHTEGNKFYFSDGDARVEIRVVSDEIIRVRLAPHGVFLDDFSYAVPVVDQKVTTFKMEEQEEHYAISTNTVTCKIRKNDFNISFIDNISQMVMSEDDSPMHWEENVDFG